MIDHVLPRPLERPRRPLRQNPPRTLLPPHPTPPPHRPLRRPFRAQNALLPLRIRQQQVQRLLIHNVRLSHLLDRAQRNGPQPAVRTPHQKLRRERSGRPADWEDLRAGPVDGFEREGGSGRGSCKGSDDRRGL